jgi:cell division protein FtsB
MNRNKIIIPIFIGTLIYSVLSFSLGPRGLWPMSQISEHKATFSSNLEVLYTINQDMNARLQNLSADPDTISVYAHELGYVAEGEKLIKLAGFSGGIERNLIAGNAISVKKPLFLSEWICKTFGIVSGLFGFFILSTFIWGKKQKKL